MNQYYAKNNTFSYVYCVILVIILVTWTSQTVAPPTPVRFLYLLAVMIIPFFSKAFFLPAAFSCLFIISKNGFAYSYLPQGDYNYSIALFLVYILLIKPSKTNYFYSKTPRIIILLMFYVLFVDIVNYGSIEHLVHCLFILMMLFLLSNNEPAITNQNENIKIFVTFFSLSALALFYFYYRYGYMFSIVYKNLGLETVGWTDPNYFSSTIGMLVLSSIIILSNKIKTNAIEKVLFVLTAVVGIPIMVSCASRGALLALAISGSYLLLFSKLKWPYKTTLILLIVAFIFYLYTNDTFQLLQNRIEADDNTGTGRVDIWKNKLDLFFQGGNPFYLIFGMGAYKGIHLGGTEVSYSCFHNDYIAYLVSYGVIGLILFILFLLSPILKVPKKSSFRPAVIASVLYLATCGLTINPLSEGYLAYFCFYFFIHQLCLVDNKNSINRKDFCPSNIIRKRSLIY